MVGSRYSNSWEALTYLQKKNTKFLGEQGADQVKKGAIARSFAKFLKSFLNFSKFLLLFFIYLTSNFKIFL